jgi:hypothetical protein
MDAKLRTPDAPVAAQTPATDAAGTLPTPDAAPARPKRTRTPKAPTAPAWPDGFRPRHVRGKDRPAALAAFLAQLTADLDPAAFVGGVSNGVVKGYVEPVPAGRDGLDVAQKWRRYVAGFFQSAPVLRVLDAFGFLPHGPVGPPTLTFVHRDPKRTTEENVGGGRRRYGWYECDLTGLEFGVPTGCAVPLLTSPGETKPYGAGGRIVHPEIVDAGPLALAEAMRNAFVNDFDALLDALDRLAKTGAVLAALTPAGVAPAWPGGAYRRWGNRAAPGAEADWGNVFTGYKNPPKR